MRVGLIDQRYKDITWLGPYKRNLTSQQCPNEFMFGCQNYNINEYGCWKISPTTICQGDPWVENGKLCGRVIGGYLPPHIPTISTISTIPTIPVVHVDPTNKNNIPCRFFASNSCTKGDLCEFRHSYKDIPCSFFAKGNCTRGNKCKYGHK
ncbi:zinc-finger protein [Indivirus ILV1]|uniref:Zinc-finger protein n=1 Tax=Indivirus ILV1 TaxID=1977633 RepID=A0A1V0SE42_9VIRU|nr:zinc-finger protein [Indivirus ILV1]